MGIYQQLAQSGDDYHNLLAQERLGKNYNKREQAQPSSRDFQRLDQDIHFRRAFTLKKLMHPTVILIVNGTGRYVRHTYVKMMDYCWLLPSVLPIWVGMIGQFMRLTAQ
jgi:soluble lytic murein transglycosylase